MLTEARTVTADELSALPDDGWQYELLEGVLQKLPPPGEDHAAICLTIGASLLEYVKSHQLGLVTSERGFILRTNPDTVRAPDVAFVRQERIAATGRIRGYRQGAPDLAIEVNPPNDRPGDIATKVREYLAAGALMVIVIDPEPRLVTVYQAPDKVTFLTVNDMLDGGDVVPGWQLPVASIFD
ncbi:MAG TPA: Uma2 family endonuclease [Chloroflexia bacterium]|nr:Uma2 family endonuclease [Chloroflexia bacterium]